jgi:hypothetical protein
MGLKAELRKNIKGYIGELKQKVTEHESALSLLPEINPRNADYIVTLSSYWTHTGEKSTTTEHIGNLEEAIKRAEGDFKLMNNRSDVQAEYRVQIKIGKKGYLVPKEFWENYKEKRT